MDEDIKQETKESDKVLEEGERKKEEPSDLVDQKENARTFYKYYIDPDSQFVIDKVLKWAREESVKYSLYRKLQHQFIVQLLSVYQEVHQATDSDTDTAIFIDKKVLEDNLYNYLDKIAFSDKGDFDLSFLDHNSSIYKNIELLREVKKYDDIDTLLIMVMAEPRLIKSQYVFDQIWRILLSAELRKQRDFIPGIDIDEVHEIYTPGAFSPEMTEKLISEIIKFFRALLKAAPRRRKDLPPDEVLAQMVEVEVQKNREAGIKAYVATAVKKVADKYGVATKTVRDKYHCSRKR